ncbi:MAG: hypothetical protein I8H75_05150 [Myxococcaceae bacterium]|nr:hypothetical protein [Myxococcaceae bacterium]MBH2006710.1 hypothetical protein [Myxococcaceae bacterium]
MSKQILYKMFLISVLICAGCGPQDPEFPEAIVQNQSMKDSQGDEILEAWEELSDRLRGITDVETLKANPALYAEVEKWTSKGSGYRLSRGVDEKVWRKHPDGPAMGSLLVFPNKMHVSLWALGWIENETLSCSNWLCWLGLSQ